MATYSSDTITLHKPAEVVYAKLSNLDSLKDLLAGAPTDQLDEEKRKMLEQITVTPDSITIPAGPVGQLTLRVAERREPTLLTMRGEGTPVPLSVAMHITPRGAEECEAQCVIDIQVPAMLKPMISGPMKKMSDQFAKMLRAISF